MSCAGFVFIFGWNELFPACLAVCCACSHPTSIVGEFGVDRAAVIPTTKAATKLEHQLGLLARHIALAAEVAKPVSLHCVRGYGHLAQLFRELEPHDCPPKVCTEICLLCFCNVI